MALFLLFFMVHKCEDITNTNISVFLNKPTANKTIMLNEVEEKVSKKI